MPKDNDKEESKFGFKDKCKAEETLKLLEEHDMQYRKLTVRGLLGRAKRVLSMTKAGDKIKNINEAMSVFENWLEENGGGASNKNTKVDDNDKVDTVSGLGFKDKDAAKKTLRILEGRDPDYQKLAVKGLVGSSKRVLSGTKNDEKIKAIHEGVSILEHFLEKFDSENRSKDNMAYLAYNIISAYPKPEKSQLVYEFIETYGNKANGNYKHLRTMYPKDDDSTSWDIIRNKNLKEIREKISKDKTSLFKEDGYPTHEHLKMIYWAYSPQQDKVKTHADKLKNKCDKRKSSESSEATDGDDSGDGTPPPTKKRRN